jgi:hypothetical protein
VQVKVPESNKVGAGGPCLSHFHCTPTGLFCSSRKVCEPCRFCSIDRFDAVDGMCPQELCPKSGGFPECVDGERLLQDLKQCKSSYPFSVWRYMETEVAPEVQPKPKPRPKYITPYNRMVGALMVTQRRKKQTNCSVENALIQRYLDTSGAVCQSTEETDSSPFSLDPTFQRFSDIYNGKLEVDTTYFDGERADDTDRNPFAFFPHSHDPLKFNSKTRSSHQPSSRKLTITNQAVQDLTKQEQLIHEASRKLFKLYFDELPTGKQGDRMLAFLRDGKFIDSK